MNSERFSSLLRSSRLTSLSRPLDPIFPRQRKSTPTHQVISTTPGSFHRRNWGLKTQIPAKHKSLYLNVDALDSPEGLAQYEAGSGFYRKLQRFREMGVPIQLGSSSAIFKRYSYLDPAPTSKNKSFYKMTPKERQRLMDKASQDRTEFSQWLKSLTTSEVNDSSPLRVATQKPQTRASLGKFAERFYGLAPTHSSARMRSAIGLNYGQKGSLNNTPSGMFDKKWVPGRQVAFGDKRALPAIGGFVCDSGVRPGYTSVSKVRKYKLSDAVAMDNGGVMVKALEYQPDSSSNKNFYK